MKPPVGAFISASSVFPEITPGIETLRQTLESLDCREVTFMCARLNLIVSDQLIVTENNDSWEKRQSLIQSELAKALFSQRQIGRMNHFIRTSRIPNGEWTLIFRGQLLELIRWACRFCGKFPGQNLLGDPEVKEAFSKALLIASDLWHSRVYGDAFTGPMDLEDRRMTLLPRFREAHSETVAGPDLTRAFVRGRSIICNYLASLYPSFAGDFKAVTNLSLDEYYLCLMTVLLRSLGLDAPADTPRIAVERVFNQSTFYQNFPRQELAFQSFLQLESQTISQLANSLWPDPSVENMEAAGFDRNVIRLHPIVRDDAGWAIVVDPVLFAEKAAVGPLFRVLGDHAARAFRRFGKAAEKYFHELLRSCYPLPSGGLYDPLACPLMGIQGRKQEVEVADACVDYIETAVLMEHKAVWVHETASAGNVADYAQHLLEKYEIAQLPTNIQRLARGEWTVRNIDLSATKRIIPVLVTYDYRMEAPLHPRFFALEFSQALTGSKTLEVAPVRVGRFLVVPLILMTIDDLEILENSLQNFSLRDLLIDYSEECADRQVSFKNFLAMSGKYRDRVIFPHRVRERFSAELHSLGEAFQGGSPDSH